MRPLEGMRVVDLGHAVAAPVCTYQLGLMGAEIVKIERPGKGDSLRMYTAQGGVAQMSTPFVAVNAGKKSLALNLQSPEGREVLYRLIAQADVLVENFRPGVAARMGISWEQAQSLNPRIVYCSLSGFGQDGPLRDWAAYDNVIQAFSGVMDINRDPGGGPAQVGFPVADVFSGHVAAFAIVTALLQRERLGPKGQGQYVDVSMADSMMVLMNMAASRALMGERPQPRKHRNAGFSGLASSGTFETRDGYITIAANLQPQLEKLFAVLGAPEVLQDPRFADHESRMENTDAFYQILTDLLASWSVDELEARLTARQVAACKVRALDEVLGHPHFDDRKIFADVAVPGRSEPGRVVGAAFRFSSNGPGVPASVPTLGEHTRDVLREIGYSDGQIDELAAAQAISMA